MSKPFDYADGATGGEPQRPPNVYLPQEASPPAYDAYADPAAAHGWQDVYDRMDPAAAPRPGAGATGSDGADHTGAHAYPGDAADGSRAGQVYPGGGGEGSGRGHAHPGDAVAGSGTGHAYPGDGMDGSRSASAYPGDALAHPYPGGSDGVGETRELPVVPGPGGRAGAGHRARRKPPAWRSRRVAVAAGAVGVVSAAVLVAGFSFSGASSGGTRGGEGGRSDPAGEPPAVSPTDTGPAASPDAPLAGRPERSDGTSGATSASPSPSVSRTPSASGTDGARPPAGDATTPAESAPSPTATASAPGRADGKPGRGPGGTKGPK